VVGTPKTRGSTLTPPHEAYTKADKLNGLIDSETEGHVFPEPHKVLTAIRGFLITNDQENNSNNAIKLLRVIRDHDLFEIVLGPPIDKGLSDTHYKFDSGARLSFGITLRSEGKQSRLVSYRFHYVFRDGHSPQFIRFDLNPTGREAALQEPRCHLHPGLEKTRLPARVLSPIEILERVFFVLEDCTCDICKG
jgi:hypothetical protein